MHNLDGANMVQVIENRSDLRGRLIEMRDDPTRPDHKLVTILVSAVSDVETFPNLLSTIQHQLIELVIPTAEIGAIKSGDNLRCRARRTGPMTVFAEQCVPTE
jgi:hypothetical protein